MSSRGLRRNDPFQASASRRAINIFRKGLTWKSLLEMVNYIASDDIRSQHPGSASAMTGIPQLFREEVPHRDERALRARKRSM